MTRARRQAGFTLIELLVVISIIGLLAAVLVSVTGGIFGKAETGVAKQQISALETAIASYESEQGVFPDDATRNQVTGGPRDAPPQLFEALMGEDGNEQLAKWDPKYIGVFRDGDPTHAGLCKPVTPEELRDPNVVKVFLDPWMRPYHYVEWKSKEEDGEVVTIPLGSATSEDKPDPAAKGEIERIPGQAYIIWSNGKNGINENGAGDDVCNWK